MYIHMQNHMHPKILKKQPTMINLLMTLIVMGLSQILRLTPQMMISD